MCTQHTICVHHLQCLHAINYYNYSAASSLSLLTVSSDHAVSQRERCRCAHAAQWAALQVVVQGRLGRGEREGRGLCSRVVWGEVIERSLGARGERSRRRNAAGGGGVARHVQCLRYDWRIAGGLVSIIRLAENAGDSEGGRSRLGGGRRLLLAGCTLLLLFHAVPELTHGGDGGPRERRDLHLQRERVLRLLRERRELGGGEGPRQGQWKAHSRDARALHARRVHRHHTECFSTGLKLYSYRAGLG